MPCEPKIGEREQRDQLLGVLTETKIANLGEVKFMLDDTDQMFDDSIGRAPPSKSDTFNHLNSKSKGDKIINIATLA